MRTGFLGYGLVGLVLYLVLGQYQSQFKWIALGFGVVMIVFGLFSKTREVNIHQVPEEVTAEPELGFGENTLLDEDNPKKGETSIKAEGKDSSTSALVGLF